MRKEISGSVGRYGINRATDVAVVQELINCVPITAGGPVLPIPIDGFCGERTKSAIQQFQREHFSPDDVDGRVEPGSPTLLRLLEFARNPRRDEEKKKNLSKGTFLIRRVGSEEFFEDTPREQFYEVTNVVEWSKAVYWLGFPSQRQPVPEKKFQGKPESFEVMTDGEAPELEGPATYTTRMDWNSVASQLTLRLSTGRVEIPMSTHLLKLRPAGTAIFAGFFQKVKNWSR